MHKTSLDGIVQNDCHLPWMRDFVTPHVFMVIVDDAIWMIKFQYLGPCPHFIAYSCPI